jgi:TraM recognition site of TraD and TraG
MAKRRYGGLRTNLKKQDLKTKEAAVEKLPSSTAQMACRLRRHGLPLGTDIADGTDVHLNLKRLARHVHLIGPPGTGKTRELLGIFQALCALPEATVIVINPKGALCRMARDRMIELGMAKRLVWFDPGDLHAVIGYNPMEPNGLPVFTHAKVVREGIRSAWGQSSFDDTPRLAKYLFLALAIARTFQLGLFEALQLLRPGGGLRRDFLPRISNPFLRESLTSFDDLSRNLQEERSESAITRLEAFVCDPINLRILTHTPSLNLSDVIERHQVLLVNLEIGQPLVEDDVKLWGRFLVNDILNHVRRRTAGPNITPVYLLCDEVQFFATRDLCHTLATGRELGLHLLAAHQELSQLRDEDKGGDLYHAIMGCARTKLLFGGLSVEDLRILAPEVKIDQYSPLIVKDQRTSLEIEPVESTREVVTRGHTIGRSLGVNKGASSAIARGRSHGVSRQWGASQSHGDILSVSHQTQGHSDVNGSGATATDTNAEFQAEGEQDTTSVSQTEGRQTSFAATFNHSRSESRSQVPFVEQHVRRVVSSRTFLTPEEIDRIDIREIKGQADGHFLMKTDNHPAVFCRAFFVPDPKLSPAKRDRVMGEIFGQPIYTKPEPTVLPHDNPSLLAPPMVESTEVDPWSG